MDSRILDELEAAFGQELALVRDDLGALESAVQSKLRQLGQGLLQRLLAREPHGYQGSSIPCSCGGGCPRDSCRLLKRWRLQSGESGKIRWELLFKERSRT